MSTHEASRARNVSTIPFILYLRGTAPVLVMWAHLSGFWLYAHHREWRAQTDWATYVARPLNLFENAGHIGVVLFFFVSGYIVTYASGKETVRDFGIKRVFRLIPALWLAVAVVALTRFIARQAGVGYPTGTNGAGLVSYIRGGFLLDMLQNKIQINGVTWTLVVEVTFYVLTALAMVLTRRAPAAATLLMLATWAVGAVTVHHYPSTRHLDYFTIYVGLLLLGRSLYLSHGGIITTRRGLQLSAVIVVVSIVVYQHSMPGTLQASDGPANTYVLAFLIFVAFMYAAPKRVPWAVRQLSDISYSLYLLHIPVGMLTINLVLKAGAPFTVALLAAVAMSIAAAAVSYRLIERPSQRGARGVIKALTPLPRRSQPVRLPVRPEPVGALRAPGA